VNPAPTGPPPSTPDTVVVHGLRKTFGTMVAVEGLDLTIHRGEVFGLLGPNGSGKTTTIRMLCGLMVPSGGSATVVGFDVVREAE
jgi:ABC-2 type transport system ATP-binding protein